MAFSALSKEVLPSHQVFHVFHLSPFSHFSSLNDFDESQVVNFLFQYSLTTYQGGAKNNFTSQQNKYQPKKAMPSPHVGNK